jgi:hypothetical protein
VEGDMVGLGALDLILRSVRARMMGVTPVIEVAGMDADDRAADATSLGNSSSRDHGSGGASPRSSAPMPPKNCKRRFSR